MKTKITILLTLATYIIIATSCVKTTPKGVAYCGQLPCPTSTGANIVSCLIDGQPFISIGGKPQDGMLIACHSGNYISYSALGSTTNFNFKMCTKTNPTYIYIYIGDSLYVNDFIIGDYKSDINIANLNNDLGSMLTDSSKNGDINITKVTNNIISGTFNFKVKNQLNNKYIEITNGSFDLAK